MTSPTINPGRIQDEFGFGPGELFQLGLAKTVRWYLTRHAAGHPAR
jgi:dTDP-D-glucose 4,6-dehydratase